jgi:hypothetical protein
MHPLVCGYDECTTHVLKQECKRLDHHFRAQGYGRWLCGCLRAWHFQSGFAATRS